MLRVFLVEDEQNLRETLRETIPWEQCGCCFSGEAEDGEIALPLLRQVKPDVLITDIQMPFMNGLSLSALAKKEFPQIKIILLSEDGSFESAQRAIEIGASRCLKKPVAKSDFITALKAVREQIEDERRGYPAQYRLEAQEYEQYARRRFLERMTSGQLSVQQIYEEAAALELDLRAQSYTIALFSIPPETRDIEKMDYRSDSNARVRDALLEHFLKYSEYILLRWDWDVCTVLIKGSRERIGDYTVRCINAVRNQYSRCPAETPWYIAVGNPTQRLSALPACFEEVSRLWACRYLLPAQHILTTETVNILVGPDDNHHELDELARLDPSQVNPARLLTILQSGRAEEIPDFVENDLQNLGNALKSRSFCQYLMLSTRFTATEYAMSLGIPAQEFLRDLTCLDLIGRSVTRTELKRCLIELLTAAVEWRDHLSGSQGRQLFRQATAYIDRHFTEAGLSLSQIAREVNVSANYLSAVFSQEMGRTLTEYITGKRMERARELLRNTDQRSGEIAQAVGYRDPRYFSALFKKNHGCTPRDYRKNTRLS